MPDRSRKRPRDPNELAKFVVDAATDGLQDEPIVEQDDGKNPAAVALGRLGGLKGGKARAARMSPDQRRQIALKAAAARWKDK